MPCCAPHRQQRTGRSIDACEAGAWAFAYWERAAAPGGSAPFRLSDVKGGITKFRCKSWRHAGECRDLVFRRDFRRIMDALESRPAWMFAVLTVSRACWKSGKAAAYKNFWRAWQRLRQRLERFLGRKIHYIAVMEQHRDGWPHMNLALHWDAMETVDDLQAYAAGVQRWMKDRAPSCGLGHSVFCEAVENQKNIAGYFSGQALGGRGNGPRRDEDEGDSELRQMAGEINKQSKAYQVPTDAPLGFRRIRSSRGLLAPVASQGDYTGCIHQPSRSTDEGTPGEASEAGARGGAPHAGGAIRGSGGGAPGYRPPAKRAARPRIEQFTANITEERRYWWKLALLYRRDLEAAGLSEPVILSKLKALQADVATGQIPF